MTQMRPTRDQAPVSEWQVEISGLSTGISTAFQGAKVFAYKPFSWISTLRRRESGIRLLVTDQ
jgi:hypothetical protein